MIDFEDLTYWDYLWIILLSPFILAYVSILEIKDMIKRNGE